MGSLVKHNLIKLLDISSEQIYHVTVMPCYDKKLEASREDFFNQQTKTKDVDCVITPGMYISISTFNFPKLLESKINYIFSS